MVSKVVRVLRDLNDLKGFVVNGVMLKLIVKKRVGQENFSVLFGKEVMKH